MSAESVTSQGSQVRERAVMVVRMYLAAVMLCRRWLTPGRTCRGTVSLSNSLLFKLSGGRCPSQRGVDVPLETLETFSAPGSLVCVRPL